MNPNNLARARHYLEFWRLTGFPDYLSGAVDFFRIYRLNGGSEGADVRQAFEAAGLQV